MKRHGSVYCDVAVVARVERGDLTVRCGFGDGCGKVAARGRKTARVGIAADGRDVGARRSHLLRLGRRARCPQEHQQRPTRDSSDLHNRLPPVHANGSMVKRSECIVFYGDRVLIRVSYYRG